MMGQLGAGAQQQPSKGDIAVRRNIASHPVANGNYVSASCGNNNNECTYSLSGPNATSMYVYEHQTSSGITRTVKVGDDDYVSPSFNGVKANTGAFGLDGIVRTFRYLPVLYNI